MDLDTLKSLKQTDFDSIDISHLNSGYINQEFWHKGLEQDFTEEQIKEFNRFASARFLLKPNNYYEQYAALADMREHPDFYHGGRALNVEFDDKKILNLEKKGLTFIPRFIKYYTKVEELNVARNAIRHLPGFLFALPNLRILRAENNVINSVSFLLKGKKRNTKLEILSLSYNQLEEFEAFYLLRGLKTLLLRKNKIKGISNLSELELDNLEILDLGSNPLSLELDFSGVPNVKLMYLDDCNFSQVPNIKNLEQLEEIDLGNNKLNFNTPEDSIPSNNLEKLLLYNNRISTLEGFSKYDELILLDLGFNEITTKDLDPIFQLPKLSELYLDNNLIETVPKKFENLRLLARLDLRNNKITQGIENLNRCPNLVFLYIEGNPGIKNVNLDPEIKTDIKGTAPRLNMGLSRADITHTK